MTRKHPDLPEEEKIPEDMLCPINKAIMIDPVMASDGHTYDRDAIEQWLMRKGTSPNTNMQLEDKKLLPNYTLRKLIDEYLTDEQKEQRSLADEARKKDPNSYDRQMLEQRLQAVKESLISGYSQAYEQLCTTYEYDEAKTEIRLSLQELESILSQFSAFEWLLREAQWSLTDLLGIEVNARTLVLQKLSYLNQLAAEHHMPIANYLQLDYQTMIACNRAMQSLCYLVAEKRVGWPLLLQLSQYEYDFIKRESNLVRQLLREHPWLRFDIIRPLFQQIDQAKINPPPAFSYDSSLTGRKALSPGKYAMHLVFSDPKNTDHLSVKQLVAALTKSPKEAVRTFLKVPGNVDKLFARISAAERSAILDSGWGIPESPGGLGELRARPDDAGGFRMAMMELSARHLKGHVVYYERTKEYLPNIIKSLDDLKKVLEWLFPHQCQDILERLRNSGQLNKLIKTPDDLAQLLNSLNMHPKTGLFIDFEASEFHPDVLYVGKGEERTVNYAFLPAYDQPVLRGVLSTTDVPELKDEKWLNSDHRSQFPALCIREALSHKHGIIFQNKNPAGVLQGLDAKVAEEEVSFLRSLLPNRWAFQQALRLLQPDRQEFLRQAMQPYLHLEPYQELVLPPPPTTHSNTVVRPSHAPRPICVAPAKPYNLIIYDRQKLQDAHDELRDTLNGIHGPVQDILSRADVAQAVRVCFPTLIDFKKFMSALSGYCSRSKKDLLYRTWREAIDENIHSIHDLFLVSQCLGDEGKALLYSNEHNKIMLENWRKAYPQVKDQYLMLLRAAVGYPGYKDEHAPCEQVSALRKVAACLMVFFWAFWTHLSPTSEAEKQIRTLATSEPNFFTSPSKRAAAIFVDGLNERVDERSSAEFLANQS